MGALTLMIIFIGFLATGATRHYVYNAWHRRVGGRISCATVNNYIFILQFCICQIILLTHLCIFFF